MTDVRILDDAQAPMVDRYLAATPSTTMFLRSNLRGGGIVSQPTERYEGAYAGVFDAGELVGIVGHFWNGMLLMQSETGLEEAARLAVETTRMEVSGMIGPLEQVEELVEALRLADHPRTLDSEEYLYDLELDDLVLPELLVDGDALCRVPTVDDLDLLVEWRAAYYEETLSDTWSSPRESMLRYIQDGTCRVLEVDGELVSYTHFNATLPDTVQVGGVWTPPTLRSRGYGRSVVAGHLRDAAAEGVERAILFTAYDNVPAQHAYEALGFRRIGDYGLLLFEEAVEL